MTDYTYYAVYELKRNGGELKMLLREQEAEMCRWVPHLHEWVEMPDHWDYLVGHSSTAMTVDARKVSQDEAEKLGPLVYDLPDAVVEKRRAVR